MGISGVAKLKASEDERIGLECLLAKTILVNAVPKDQVQKN